MSIINIKNPYVRKLVIIFAAPTFIFLAAIGGAAIGAIESFKEAASCFVSAWRGKL